MAVNLFRSKLNLYTMFIFNNNTFRNEVIYEKQSGDPFLEKFLILKVLKSQVSQYKVL